jgi:hypothetical protein
MSNQTALQRMDDFARTYNTPYVLNAISTALSPNLVPALGGIVRMNDYKAWSRSNCYLPFLS